MALRHGPHVRRGRRSWVLGLVAWALLGPAGVYARARAEDQPPAVHVGVPLLPSTARGLLAWDRDRKPDGFAVQLTREAFKAAGINVEFVQLPRDMDMITALNAPQGPDGGPLLDAVIPLSISEERSRLVDFSMPIVVCRGVIIGRDGMPPVETIEDLRGKRVIVADKGIGHVWCLEQGIKHNIAPNFLETLRAVAQTRADYAVSLQMAERWQIEQSNIKGLREYPLWDSQHIMAFALAGRLGNETVSNEFNRGLALLRDSGRYDQLYNEWLEKYQPTSRPAMVRLAWLRLVTALAIALLAAAAVWQVVMYRRLVKRTRLLRESESALRQITEALDQVVWLFDLKAQKVLFLSAAFERVYGLPTSAMHKDPRCWRSVVHPEDRAMASRAVEGGNADSAGCDVHYRVVRPDGSIRWVHDRAVPVKGPSGELEYVAGVAEDVTELREMQEALREREGYYRSLFENSNDAFMIFEPEGERILSVNERACAMYGYTAAQLTRLSMEDLSTNVSRGKERIAETMTAGTHDEFLTQHRRRDGTLIDVEIRAAVIEHRGRRVILSVNRDVTERRLAEESRRRLDEQVMQSQKLESLGVLVGGVAHDFNNLLAGVLGNAGVAIRGLAADDPARRNLEQIQAAATRAADLTRNMLAYAGEGRITPRPVDLAALVRDTLTLVAGSIARSATVRVKAETGLPLVECDAAQVSQVIMNLVLNASDALKEGHGAIEIATRLGRPGEVERQALFPAGWSGLSDTTDMVCLEVRDEGCGIPAEIVPRIFDPFFTTKFAGRGLGLAAALGIVRGHGGVIGVTSEPGRGSTFRVWFPALAGTAGAAGVTGHGSGAEVKSSAGPGGAMAAAGAIVAADAVRGTLLVVDDERMVLDMVAVALEGAGFGVVKASGGVEALRLLVEPGGRIDGVLLDLTMPEMDGEQVLRAMRATNPNTPVVLMSGYGEKQVIERLAGVEVKSFLAKPFRLEDLIATARGMVVAAAERKKTVVGPGEPVAADSAHAAVDAPGNAVVDAGGVGPDTARHEDAGPVGGSGTLEDLGGDGTAVTVTVAPAVFSPGPETRTAAPPAGQPAPARPTTAEPDGARPAPEVWF